MNGARTPLVHPLDLVGATGDEAAARPSDAPLHLNADDDDWPSARLPAWINMPLGALLGPEHPLRLVAIGASLLAVIIAMVVI